MIKFLRNFLKIGFCFLHSFFKFWICIIWISKSWNHSWTRQWIW